MKAHDHHRGHHALHRCRFLVPFPRLSYERMVPERRGQAPRRASHQSQPDRRGEQALEARPVSVQSYPMCLPSALEG